jgi:3-phenylpropionate/cinnamic acid dioxygenase small subunit
MTQLGAVEQIRATIACYCQALDDRRYDDLLAVWSPDGVFEIPGMDVRAVGHDGLRAYFSSLPLGGKQRHLVTNTLVTELTETEAHSVSDLAVLQLTDTGWTISVLGRYDDTHSQEDGVWRFQHRRLEFQ